MQMQQPLIIQIKISLLLQQAMTAAKAKAKEKILKIVIPLSTKLGKIKSLPIVKKNKVRPISPSPPSTNHNEILLLREASLSFGRRDGEYLQARRAVLSSYHLINGGDSLKQKMRSALKGLCRDVGAAVKTRVGVRVYRFTVATPWSASGKVIVFRCFLPHLKP